MTYNSDIGSYTYTKAHQVKTAGNRAYTYDANGNMILNNGKTIEYTVSNKPSKLGDVEFFYNANDDRYKRTEGNKTTHYIGKTYEKEISSNTHRYFIYANGKVVAIYDSTYKSIYLHYDALNSVDTITDTQGTVVQRKAYTAYGKEITTDDFFPYSTKRGYTGHEHIDDSLIHMNGRVYDSAIGRFISADPNIFHPFMTQNFDRYSYVMNNPLKYIDPSGFDVGFAGRDVGSDFGNSYGENKDHNNSDESDGHGSVEAEKIQKVYNQHQEDVKLVAWFLIETSAFMKVLKFFNPVKKFFKKPPAETKYLQEIKKNKKGKNNRRQVFTDKTREEVEESLRLNGFKQSKAKRDQDINIFEKDGHKYTTRSKSNSPEIEGPTLDYTPPSGKPTEIRLSN